MNNLSSYCGLVDTKIRASYNDLPVYKTSNYSTSKNFQSYCALCSLDVIELTEAVGAVTDDCEIGKDRVEVFTSL